MAPLAKTKVATGVLIIPRLSPAVPVRVKYPSGRIRTLRTSSTQRLKVPVGGYWLLPSKPVNGWVAATPQRMLTVNAGKTVKSGVKAVRNTSTLTVRFTNVPAGGGAKVSVAGAGKKRTVAKATVVRGLRPGHYIFEGSSIRLPDGSLAVGTSPIRDVYLKAGLPQTITFDWSTHSAGPTVTDMTGKDVVIETVNPNDYSATVRAPGQSPAVGSWLILDTRNGLPHGYLGRVTAVNGGVVTAVAANPMEVFPHLPLAAQIPPEEFAKYASPAPTPSLRSGDTTKGGMECSLTSQTPFLRISIPDGGFDFQHDGLTPQSVKATVLVQWSPNAHGATPIEAACDLTVHGQIPTVLPWLWLEPSIGVGASMKPTEQLSPNSGWTASLTEGRQMGVQWTAPAGLSPVDDEVAPPLKSLSPEGMNASFEVYIEGGVTLRAGAQPTPATLETEASIGVGTFVKFGNVFDSPPRVGTVAPVGKVCAFSKTRTLSIDASATVRLSAKLLFVSAEANFDLFNQHVADFPGTPEPEWCGDAAGGGTADTGGPTGSVNVASCNFMQELPYAAHYSPPGGSLPKWFQAKTDACAAYSKQTGTAVSVTFGNYDSTIWPWSAVVTDAINNAGGHATFVDHDSGPTGSCKAAGNHEAVCVSTPGGGATTVTPSPTATTMSQQQAGVALKAVPESGRPARVTWTAGAFKTNCMVPYDATYIVGLPPLFWAMATFTDSGECKGPDGKVGEYWTVFNGVVDGSGVAKATGWAKKGAPCSVYGNGTVADWRVADMGWCAVPAGATVARG